MIYGLGNNMAAQETPSTEPTNACSTASPFSQDTTGVWTASDISWVPSLPAPASRTAGAR